MVLLSSKSLGSIVNISGMEFLVGAQETARTLVVKREPFSTLRAYDTDRSGFVLSKRNNSLGYWLNVDTTTGFMSMLSEKERNAILDVEWRFYYQSGGEVNGTRINLKVGILDMWGFAHFKNGVGSNIRYTTDEWSSTPNGYGDMVVMENGSPWSKNDFPDAIKAVRPAFYLPSTLDINADGSINFNNAPFVTTIPPQSTQLGTNKTINLSTYFNDADGDSLTYTASSSNTAVGTVSVSGSTLTLRPVALGSTTITVAASDGQATTNQTFAVNVVNSVPIVSVTAPSNNQTLYENDTFSFTGSVNDVDLGNSVTIRYQINAETVRAIDAFLSTGAAKAFSKQLTFRGGSLYDGETLIASGLTDGVAHTLKIYATDDAGGQSEISTRTFYVVPNRAPVLTINPITITGNIDSDKITVNGSYSDADNNATTVKYRINGGNSIQVASGTSGNFNFELLFGQLVDGLNTIVIEATDSYGAKTSKTIKLNKNVVATELLKSTARYKILPPTGSAKAVLLWIQRDKGLAIKVSVSMTMAGEAESFTALTATNSAPLANNSAIIEDEFYREGTAAKDNIIVQIDLTRSSVGVKDAITLISGVLE